MKKIIVSLSVASLLLSGITAAAEQHKHHRQHPPKHSITSNSTGIDINRADNKTLTQLKGIGPKKADAIIAYRNTHGNFHKLEDLTAVKGISHQWIKKLSENNPHKIRLTDKKDSD